MAFTDVQDLRIRAAAYLQDLDRASMLVGYGDSATMNQPELHADSSDAANPMSRPPSAEGRSNPATPCCDSKSRVTSLEQKVDLVEAELDELKHQFFSLRSVVKAERAARAEFEAVLTGTLQSLPGQHYSPAYVHPMMYPYLQTYNAAMARGMVYGNGLMPDVAVPGGPAVSSTPSEEVYKRKRTAVNK